MKTTDTQRYVALLAALLMQTATARLHAQTPESGQPLAQSPRDASSQKVEDLTGVVAIGIGFGEIPLLIATN